MSYKTTFDKFIKLITSVNPPVIFINGIINTRRDELAKILKNINYSVFNIRNTDANNIKNEISKYLKKSKKFQHQPIAILAEIHNTQIIDEIFVDEYQIFTYVYLYPNNQIEYRNRLNADNLQSAAWYSKTIENLITQVASTDNEKQVKTGVNRVIVELFKFNQELYKKHCEEFDNKILTVLV